MIAVSVNYLWKGETGRDEKRLQKCMRKLLEMKDELFNLQWPHVQYHLTMLILEQNDVITQQ